MTGTGRAAFLAKSKRPLLMLSPQLGRVAHIGAKRLPTATYPCRRGQDSSKRTSNEAPLKPETNFDPVCCPGFSKAPL